MTLHRNLLIPTLATFGALAAIGCFFWGYILPVDVQAYHQQFLQMSTLGWSGMNLVSFILIVIEWAAWGALTGWILGALDAYYEKQQTKK